MRYVNQPVIKSDAMALVTGKRFIWMILRPEIVWW